MVERVCQQCGKSFETEPNRLRVGRGKYCSRKCYDTHHTRIERFWEAVDMSGGPDACWPWTRGKKSGGYGTFCYKGHTVMTHRMAYELAYGPISSTIKVLHTCDNPPCCNPHHLFLGTSQDNSRDMARKKRGRAWTHPETIARGDTHANAKLTATQVVAIRKAASEGVTLVHLAERYGVSDSAIGLIVKRLRWKHI